jgi:sugar/nucleoside kinase (ribokinase family)
MADDSFSSEMRAMPTSRFDVCVIGHVTKDITGVGVGRAAHPGGTAYYSSVALSRMGLKVAVVTKVAEEDQGFLLHNLKAENVTVFCTNSKHSSAFENTYSPEDVDARRQRILSIAEPFSPADMHGISATAFHVGPLTNRDVSVDLLQYVTARARIVSLDAQGMLRPAHVGEVREEDWPDKRKGLRYVDILKVDEKEAFVLSGERASDRAIVVLSSFGPKEVIVTMGSRGSIIYVEQTLHNVSSGAPRKTGDPTGCGDTYAAGYLSQRLKGVRPELAGRFAAAMATLKVENPGPFRGRAEDVEALLSRK